MKKNLKLAIGITASALIGLVIIGTIIYHSTCYDTLALREDVD